jgi:hypothetical protein
MEEERKKGESVARLNLGVETEGKEGPIGGASNEEERVKGTMRKLFLVARKNCHSRMRSSIDALCAALSIDQRARAIDTL